MPAIRCRLHAPGLLAAEPAGYLAGPDFGRYVAACRSAGARYDAAARAQVGPLAVLPALAAALTAAGFAPAVAPDLAAACQTAAGATQGNGAAVAERLAAIEARLNALGLRLYPFQRDGVTYLATRDRAALLDEMGCGKTPQALCALPDGAPVVVVCPAAVKGVWQHETARWLPGTPTRTLYGRGKWEWPAPGELVIGNYETLPATTTGDVGGRMGKIVHPRYGVPAPGTVVIFDEAHYCKNAQAARTKAARAVAGAVGRAGGKVWLLTGTPLTNRPPELWSVLMLAGLAQPAFGGWLDFVRLFDGTPGKWGGYEWGTPDAGVPARLARVSLRRERAAVLPDLPTKTRRAVPVGNGDFPKDALRLCDEVVAALRAEGIDLAAAVDIVELAAHGATFDLISRARQALAAAKIKYLLEWVADAEEAGEALVVFSAHLAPLDALRARPGWGLLTGDTPAEDRTQRVADFQAGRLNGLAVSIRAGGTGITLTRAHHALFVDLDWTPAGNSQAEDRLCRIGQRSAVLVTRLVAPHALDRRVEELLRQKQDLIDATVSASATVAAPPPVDLAADLAATAARYAVAEPALPVAEPAPRGPDTPAAPTPAVRLNGPRFRPAQGPAEAWAAAGLLRLAGHDPDRALVRNDVGFNRVDGDFGHSLADQLRTRGGLSEAQWRAAIRLAARYPRQVGPRPAESVAGA